MQNAKSDTDFAINVLRNLYLSLGTGSLLYPAETTELTNTIENNEDSSDKETFKIII